jgi:hypothetical protein
MLVETKQREEAKQLLDALRTLVKRSWKTLAAIKDPDGKYLGLKSGWVFSVVNDAQESYGWSAVKVRFVPSAEDISNMESVMTWMAWLRRERGDHELGRIRDWSFGVPVWKMADREGCSERTILNRIDRSLAAIIAEFMAASPEVEIIEERGGRSAESFCLERPYIGMGGSLDPGKVYIADIGWMFRGKPWNKGDALAAKYAPVRRQRAA